MHSHLVKQPKTVDTEISFCWRRFRNGVLFVKRDLRLKSAPINHTIEMGGSKLMLIMLPPVPVDVPAIIQSVGHVSAAGAAHLPSAQKLTPRPQGTMQGPQIVKPPIQTPLLPLTGIYTPRVGKDSAR